MADDIRLVISVEQGSLLKAITNTESLEKRVKKLSDTYARGGVSYGRYNRGIEQLAKATKKSKGELLSYGTAIRANAKAVGAAAIAEKQRLKVLREEKIAIDQKNKVEAANSASLQRFRISTDQVYAAEQKLLRLKKMLRAEVNAGNMSMRQAAAVQMQYKKSLTALSAAQSTSSKVLQQSKNRMNSNNMAIQQLGYQFGDFAVQVQGGTSAFVAFSQQGAQLAGILPMIAGPLGLSMSAAVKLSAALGIGIPIFSMVGRALFGMATKAKEVVDVFEGASSALDNMSSSASNAQKPLSDLADRFGEGANQARLLLGVISAIEKTRFKTAFSGAADSLRKLFDIGDFTSEGLRTLTVAGAAQKTILDGLLKQQRDFLSEGEVLSANLLGKQIAEARLSFETAFGAMNSDVLALAERLKVLPAVATEFAAVLAGIAEAKTFDEKGKAAVELSNFIRDNIDVTNELSEAENKALLKALELSLQFLESENNLSGTVDKAKDLTSGLSKAVNEAVRLRDVLQQVSITNLSMSDKAEVLRAQISAAKAGRSQAGAEATTKTAITLGRTGGSSITADEIARVALASGKAAEEVEDLENQLSALLSTPSGGSGGGGGGKSPIQTLQEQLALQQALIGKTEAQRQLINALGVDYQSKYAPSVTDALETQITLTGILIEADTKRKEALKQAAQQQEQLADYIANSMGNALMSVVDGTMTVKDAFKAMAIDIIKELYRVLVVQRMVNAAKKAMGLQADGGAWSNGSQIQAYANGGVVGGPTTFPMVGGKTGLMGEAGPEAIMPLKRGVNGKLGVQMEGGGGDTIVVNQSFNFQSNGDATIKQLIAQAAPKIAQMTKSSLLDDRRRGGSTKAAFG